MQSGTGTKESYPKYYCDIDAGCRDWCFDCDAEAWNLLKVNGPACAPGITGNCCDLSSYKPAAFDVCMGQDGDDEDQVVAACKSKLQGTHGFKSCAMVGQSVGAAPA